MADQQCRHGVSGAEGGLQYHDTVAHRVVRRTREVHQTLYHIREEGMAADLAITEATRNRVRPIFMSTLTSVFGMLPLVLFPGAGSELYRGLGSVVLGGLSLSAVLTLAIVPPMMSITVGLIERTRETGADSKQEPVAARGAAE
jgi:HAE1 family hydrophobic/amphiphilic exporter-1